MRFLLKWFVRIGLVIAGLGSLAFIPLGFFLGIMATDSLGITGSATITIVTALLIMAAPAILCCAFFVALGWVERHPKYLTSMALLISVLFVAVVRELPAGFFSGMPGLWGWLFHS